jgi:hemin uptake protein HemP
MNTVATPYPQPLAGPGLAGASANVASLAAPLTGLQALSSDALMQGRKTVAISHNGTVYRLQATRQGKLILTK